MAAAKTVIQSGDPSALERLLVGRNIWVVHPPSPERRLPGHVSGPHRILHFKRFLPAGRHEVDSFNGDTHIVDRKKHLVEVYADPPGQMTLSVGSIQLKDPGRAEGARRRAERERAEAAEDE